MTKINFQEHQQHKLTSMPSSWEMLNTVEKALFFVFNKMAKLP